MKINVGILGCTGAVGQKFISLLADHPDFNITELAASERSAGRIYKEAVNWLEPCEIPDKISNMTIKKCNADLDCRIVFSGLDSQIAGEVEKEFANSGYAVISNSKNHRMFDDVPLVIPEVNSDHFGLIYEQKKNKNTNGFIVTNPNCSTIALALCLAPVHRVFGIKEISVTTMQAISGAGYPGISSHDILGNIVPHIKDEEEKIQTETLKILGTIENKKINFADINISASCNRVPVKDGHTLSISFETCNKAELQQLLECWNDFEYEKHYSSPAKLFYLSENPVRPQPLLDINNGNGMALTIGNLRKCNVLDWKLNVLAHNTVRGAAGAAILNAEYLLKEGYIQ
ncbi:MAG TPA: aspartate-semialdehyde dehydrogenase [Ignavibacteria bacterium]|nr:aspartate-semialdehyde dehydrogenase [Ignavibacteria bacterium]